MINICIQYGETNELAPEDEDSVGNKKLCKKSRAAFEETLRTLKNIHSVTDQENRRILRA
jgi:hypothetical protein